MNNQTELYNLNRNLTFCNDNSEHINIYVLSLNLIKQENNIVESRLILQVNYELYQRIDKENIFNLRKEVRNAISGGQFIPEKEINLEITLQPNLLPELVKNGDNPETIGNYLLQLSSSQDNINPLLNTENWLCLSVKQNQQSGEVGYTTFWDYLKPSLINDPQTTSDEIAQGIVNFVQDWTETNLTEITQNATNEILNSFSRSFQELELEKPETSNKSLLEIITNFFEKDEWSFTEIENEFALRLVFRGNSGQWICYAQAREKAQQFVFYSVCPMFVPETKLIPMAEYISRANYGMIIGNFELDFNDGEIRYKTSIDIEGDRLTFPLIKQLVYANVMMMDQYLPGIIAVIEDKLSPIDAILKIENQ